MNPVKIAVGIAALAYGLVTIYVRIKDPAKFFGKLAGMKKVYGERAGLIIHTVGYTVVPILVGLFFIYSGLRGA